MAGRQVLVIPRPANLPNDGFVPPSGFNSFLQGCRWHPKEKAEQDSSLKQLVPIAVLTNPRFDKVFVYQRAPGPTYEEARLRGKLSIVVGGHIEPIDAGGRSDTPFANLVLNALDRELQEEVGQRLRPDRFKFLGTINSERTPVDRVHLGLLFLVHPKGKVVPRSAEIKEGRMMSRKQLEKMSALDNGTLESWFRLTLGVLGNLSKARSS